MLLAVQLALEREFVLKDVRIYFKKTGRMKFISHLDLQRFMIRMIRMSGIPVWYSEGFNPHPYITFALPLSLGFESTYDVMDLRLNEDSYPLKDVLDNLIGVMPEGIELFGIGDPWMKVGEIAFAEYEIYYDQLLPETAERLKKFLSMPNILTEKKNKKGKINTVDLAPSIKSFEVCDNKVSLILAAGGSNNLNPKLLIEAFENEENIKLPYGTVVRTMIYNSKMEQFK